MEEGSIFSHSFANSALSEEEKEHFFSVMADGLQDPKRLAEGTRYNIEYDIDKLDDVRGAIEELEETGRMELCKNERDIDQYGKCVSRQVDTLKKRYERKKDTIREEARKADVGDYDDIIDNFQEECGHEDTPNEIRACLVDEHPEMSTLINGLSNIAFDLTLSDVAKSKHVDF